MTDPKPVFLTQWRVDCAAGRDGAAWRACSAGECFTLQHDDHFRAPPPADLPQTARGLLADTAGRLQPPTDALPLLAVSSSKGDSGRIFGASGPVRLSAEASCWPGSVGAQVARRLGIRHFLDSGVVAACSTGLGCVLAAQDGIAQGRCRQAIAGAVDASLQELLIAGFDRLGVLAHGQAPQVFAGAATGFAIGVGCGLLALADRPASPDSWRICGAFRAGDAGHATACTDTDLLRECLWRLWRCCPQPDRIISHGTGTAAGDAYEATAYAGGPWAGIPVVAYKAQIGHCLGASAAVELALACHAPWQRFWKLGLGFGGHLMGIALARGEAP